MSQPTITSRKDLLAVIRRASSQCTFAWVLDVLNSIQDVVYLLRLIQENVGGEHQDVRELPLAQALDTAEAIAADDNFWLSLPETLAVNDPLTQLLGLTSKLTTMIGPGCCVTPTDLTTCVTKSTETFLANDTKMAKEYCRSVLRLVVSFLAV